MDSRGRAGDSNKYPKSAMAARSVPNIVRMEAGDL
jgi:hypothetical protein